ncbi:response regulator transcription factor [Pseudoclavibacter chungangensis]|uniref:Response regulator transcription factor n=1 Tax=Pseudoclavibacter chungangensis TaxID=587635 RepID=A0A7J5C1N4_9MICO|nr:response regulator transcription factor [Pseudoclavibacter chungangensis]KAB1659701.1 response regulator transcription factor [Pseudoclavibacter chungangensis]NYJ67541.1 two-component system response regulator DesR [Pseudoclavibacter chungangensis]
MTGDEPIRVVLVDDEQLLRAALAALLPLDGTIEVIAQADSGTEAIAATLRHEPDVLVIDFEMPGTDGLEAVAAIRAERPEQRVLMLTRHARPGVLRRALKLGVQGFMSKSADPEDIVEVIRALHGGGRWIAHEVLEASVVDDSPLTDREADALRETREGYAVTEIAKRLHLAPGTVRNYLSSAMQKTAATTRHEAARIARDRGWL